MADENINKGNAIEGNTTEGNTTEGNTTVDNTAVENTAVESTTVENTAVENTAVESTTVENSAVENTTAEYLSEEERVLSGALFSPRVQELSDKKLRAHRLSQEYNLTFEDEIQKRSQILKELLADIGEKTSMLGPIRFHYGCHTRIGKGCFVNFNFTVQDDAYVTIGDNNQFGPNVTIVTPMHPMIAQERRGIVCDDGVERYLCYAKPVTIGNDCWFGANVVVCPGVTVGDRCVIGAGSVVTHDIPSDSFAAGVPAKVIRQITEKDSVRNIFETIY